MGMAIGHGAGIAFAGRRPLLPLDGFGGSGLYAAFGVRRLLSGYGGPLMRVRRTSDNAEADIYPAGGGWLDSAALAAFAGAGSAFVVQWHDQTGNGRAATQATAGAQPRIVNAGVIDVGANGRPALSFDGSNDTLAIQSSLDYSRNAAALTAGLALNAAAASTECNAFASRTDGANARVSAAVSGTSSIAYARRASGDTISSAASAKPVGWYRHVIRARYAAAGLDVAVNGITTAVAMAGTAGSSADVASSVAPSIGSNATSQYFIGSIGAVVLARAALDVAAIDAALLQVMP